MAQELTARRVAYFVRLYNTPRENGTFRTLAEIAEGHGYSTPAMTQILKDAGVTITRGKRPTRIFEKPGAQIREFRGKHRGRYTRVILTLPKLRKRRLALKLSSRTVCDTLGVYRHWISNLENNMLRPTPARIRAYADALDALDAKKAKSTRAAALARCRDFTDVDGASTRPKARRSRGQSWGAFLDSLSLKERSALYAAIAYRKDKCGRKAA